MGLRSGLYGGRNRNQAPTDFRELFGVRTFVTGEIVEDDHIALVQGRGKLDFDIGPEEFSVHRPVDHPGPLKHSTHLQYRSCTVQLNAQATRRCGGLTSSEYSLT